MQFLYSFFRVFAFLLLLPTVLLAQPSNDSSCSPRYVAASGNLIVDQTNFGASVNFDEIDISDRFNDDSHTVWYNFFAPPNGMMEISTCEESEFDTELVAFTVEDCGDYSTFVEIAQNDDACGSRSRLSLTELTPGAEYFFAVDGFGIATGDFSLELTTPAPDNDLPCNARAINLVSEQGVTEGFTNQGATIDPGEELIFPGNLDGESGSVWFSFNAPNSGEITITNCDASTFDSEFTLFTTTDCGNYGTYTPVAQNDDFCGSRSGLDLTDLDPGATYYLAVDGFNTWAGNFGLNFSAPTPGNDLPCNAFNLPVDGSTQTGFTNIDATMSASEGEGEIYPANINDRSGTVWFTFTAPPSGAMSISNCGMADFDSEFTVFSITDCGDYSTYTFIDENNDALNCQGGNSLLELTDLNPGALYYLAVDGFSTNSGDFDLVLTATTVSSTKSFEAAGGSVSIYPNPSNGLVQLRVVQERSESLDLSIRDMNGRILLERHYGQPGSEMNESIDLRHLAAGIYLVNVSNGTSTKVERLVIQ